MARSRRESLLPPSCRARPRSLFSRPRDRTAGGQNAERDVQQDPDDHPQNSGELVDRGCQKSNQKGTDGREGGDHTALPDIVEWVGTVPSAHPTDAHRRQQTGYQHIATHVVAFFIESDQDLRRGQTRRAEPHTPCEGAEPEGERVLDQCVAQMWRTRPSESSAASPIASDIVGWA